MNTPLAVVSAVIILAVILFSIWRRRQDRESFRPPTVRQDEKPVVPPPAIPVESFTQRLNRLSNALVPLADKTAHPRELTELPEFQRVVDTFRGSQASLALLRQYIFGDNWPLSCAALAALRWHPERSALIGSVLAQMPKLRPWALYFALDCVSSCEPRPPVGAPVVAAPSWWAENLVIPDLFRNYFAEREAVGDIPGFGDQLDSQPVIDAKEVGTFLERLDHPFATALLDELRRWQASRIDREFLTSFGRLWAEDLDEKLLVEPDTWREQLDHAQAAVLHDPPRSLLVTGEPRVGKSSFVKLLAARVRKDGWTVFEAGAAELMADQMYIGQLEGRIRRVLEELDARKRLVWFVRDLIQIAESGTHRGQSASILDQLLPAIAAGRLMVIGEATPAGLSRLLQLRPSLRSVLEVCRLQPMNEGEAAALATAVASRLEQELRLRIAPAAVETALELAQHYLGTGQLPGVLIELLKRSASSALSAQESEVTPEGVLATLSQATGMPRAILDDKQRLELKTVRQFLTERVMGQDEAVDAVVDRIAMLKAALVDPKRPIGVFLFVGPTGTGKTELAKALAQFLFGSPERMTRLDMSEFQTAESTVRILGAYGDGAQTDSLIERVRKQPFSVILLDEFEKAHANIWDLFLQIFDDGRLTDASGRVADFRHSFIILTSNLGATSHRSAEIGFAPAPATFADDQVLRIVGRTFRPEFVNRLDKIIVFRPLSRPLMRTILRKELDNVLDRRGLRRREWAVEWEASAIEFLLDRGFSPEMGARPLKRAIDQHLLAPLAATLVERRFPEGDQFLFVRSNGKSIEVEFVDPDAETTAVEAPREPEDISQVSLPAMILRPEGTSMERIRAAAVWANVEAQLASPAWAELKNRLQAEAAAPDIWSRDDRHAIFARLALMDRVAEAARTAERLKRRLDASGAETARTSRELIARLALQLHLVQQGQADAMEDAAIDVLLIAEPVLDAGADIAGSADWCRQIQQMYRQWAERRRMQIDEYLPPRGVGPAILRVSGFGAFRTLENEAGLHVLEDSAVEEGRRVVTRVRTAAGPWQEPKSAEAYREFARLLSPGDDASVIVRRYRSGASPLVRDIRGAWRSGRLDAVLAGDFDLIGALAR